jgi:hypothetical protein
MHLLGIRSWRSDTAVSSWTAANDGLVTHYATCPAGTVLVGGGCDAAVSNGVVPRSSFPDTDRRWACEFQCTALDPSGAECEGKNVDLQTIALCAPSYGGTGAGSTTGSTGSTTPTTTAVSGGPATTTADTGSVASTRRVVGFTLLFAAAAATLA